MDYLFQFLHPSLPDPHQRIPITASAAGPVFLCYYAHAVLVLLDAKKTYYFKRGLLPLTLWLAWRTAVDYDFARGVAPALGLPDHQRLINYNYGYVISMMLIAIRSIEWTFTNDRFKRYRLQGRGTAGEAMPKSPSPSPTVGQLLLDAVDLISTQRGYGWSWARDPFPERPDQPQTVLDLIIACVANSFMLDTAHYVVQYFYPNLDTAEGDTIFHPSRPASVQFIDIMLPCTSCAFIICGAVNATYYFTAILGCVIFRHTPRQWPPISDRPWRSTSISDFWSRGWHQFFRHIFVTVGWKPLYPYFGRAGGTLGAFFVSAALHDLGMWGLGRGTEFWSVGGFFLMMGVGVILEGLWKQLTGRKVEGWVGWLWTMTWTMWWAQFLVDAWARRGFVATDFFADRYRPAKFIFDRLLEQLI